MRMFAVLAVVPIAHGVAVAVRFRQQLAEVVVGIRNRFAVGIDNLGNAKFLTTDTIT